ncbi:MAG TPA: hypothetical protein VGD31_06110 [Sphingobacteriaceae bacterium]
MKSLFVMALAASLSLVSCNQKSEHDGHEGHDAHAQDKTDISENQKLYNEVMKIHDEVMPKMNDIHKLKMSIREKIEKNPNLPQVERIKLDAMYAKLDSANEGMMVWMREFRPLPDSVGEDKARLYLQNEMTRVQKVRDNMLKAIESAEKQ